MNADSSLTSQYTNYFVTNCNEKIFHALELQYNELEQNPDRELDAHTRRYLENLIQSYLTNIISKRVCSHYSTQGLEVEEKMMRCLSGILSQKFYHRFRESFIENPDLIKHILTTIIHFTKKHPKSSLKYSDKVLLSVLRRLCPAIPSSDIIDMLIEGHDVKKEIICYYFNREIQSPQIRMKFRDLFLKGDFDLIYEFLSRYVFNHRCQRLANMLVHNEWRTELEFLKNFKLISN